MARILTRKTVSSIAPSGCRPVTKRKGSCITTETKTRAVLDCVRFPRTWPVAGALVVTENHLLQSARVLRSSWHSRGRRTRKLGAEGGGVTRHPCQRTLPRLGANMAPPRCWPNRIPELPAWANKPWTCHAVCPHERKVAIGALEPLKVATTQSRSGLGSRLHKSCLRWLIQDGAMLCDATPT